MAKDLIFLSHCMPYPPDKGEKIRAWNILRHLARTHRVHLGCVVPVAADMAHVAVLRDICASVGAFPINPFRQKLRALAHARPGKPLMPDCYTSPALRRWVDRTVAATNAELLYIYTVAMAPHALHLPVRKLLDAVDIDSEKWAEYAQTAPFPGRLIWGREGRTLLTYEKCAAAACEATLFVSPAEAARFAALAPAVADRVDWVENGVDLERFSPLLAFASPFPGAGPHMVFTGHMDYWPNADAVTWFAQDILPRIRPERSCGVLDCWRQSHGCRAVARGAGWRPRDRPRCRYAAVSGACRSVCLSAADCTRHPEQGAGSDGDGAAGAGFCRGVRGGARGAGAGFTGGVRCGRICGYRAGGTGRRARRYWGKRPACDGRELCLGCYSGQAG